MVAGTPDMTAGGGCSDAVSAWLDPAAANRKYTHKHLKEIKLVN